MGQEQKEYTWKLVAKVLASEATESELAELGALLRNNPELHYPLQTIADLWRTSGPEEQKQAEEAFTRHLDRMSALSMDLDGMDDQAGKECDRTMPGNGAAIVEHDPAAMKHDPAVMKHDPAAMKNDPALMEHNPAAMKHDSAAMGYGPAVVYPGNNRRTRSRRFLVAAATVLTLTSGGFFFYRRADTKSPAAMAQVLPGEVATRNGSRTSLYLPDGTHVWLNAGSKITYNKNFGATRREVDLSGEAYFDVAHNPASPFIIHTSRIDIRVLGTSFNVKSYPADKTTETVLIRGSIEVALHNNTNEKIILKPNEKLVVGNDETNSPRRHPVIITAAQQDEAIVSVRKPTYEPVTGAILETSWVRGQLAFQDEAFDGLALKLERWYGVTIRFADPRLETLRFTGTFRDETITEALDALKLTAHFDYTMNDNQITIAK